MADEARLDFHSCDSDIKGKDCDARIVCKNGLPNNVAGGTLSFYASQFIFHNNVYTKKGMNNILVATMDVFAFYALITNAQFADAL